MPIKVTKHIPKDSFNLICNICELETMIFPNYQFIYYHHKGGNKLLESNLFEDGPAVIAMPDKNGKEIFIEYQDNEPGYFEDKVFYKVDINSIRQYKLNIRSLIKLICKDLEIESNITEIIKDNFYRIGTYNKIPLFFARRIEFSEVQSNIANSLKNLNLINKSLILTTANNLRYGTKEIFKNRLISIRDCLLYDNKNFHVDQDIIKSVIGINKKKNGFSNGYRTAFFDDIEYKFTKKQAAIIKTLDKHGGKLNKYELLAEADSEQYDLFRIFRDNKGNYHPAWNVLIKNDAKGNYWLDC